MFKLPCRIICVGQTKCSLTMRTDSIHNSGHSWSQTNHSSAVVNLWGIGQKERKKKSPFSYRWWYYNYHWNMTFSTVEPFRLQHLWFFYRKCLLCDSTLNIFFMSLPFSMSLVLIFTIPLVTSPHCSRGLLPRSRPQPTHTCHNMIG